MTGHVAHFFWCGFLLFGVMLVWNWERITDLQNWSFQSGRLTWSNFHKIVYFCIHGKCITVYRIFFPCKWHKSILHHNPCLSPPGLYWSLCIVILHTQMLHKHQPVSLCEMTLSICLSTPPPNSVSGWWSKLLEVWS